MVKNKHEFRDGLSSQITLTTITIDNDSIKLDDLNLSWKFSDIRLVQKYDAEFGGVISNCNDENCRLTIYDEKLLNLISKKIPTIKVNFILLIEFLRQHKILLSSLIIVLLTLPLSLKFLSDQIDDEYMTKIGQEIFPILVKEDKICKNEAGVKELQKLVNKISFNKNHYHVYVSKSDNVNAFALPGGIIVIFNGLLQKFQHPNELAFVLGHEIGHVKKEHHKFSFVLSSLFSTIDSTLVNSAAFLLQMKSSRNKEIEADEFAYDLMILNNIDPHYGAAAFEHFLAKDKTVEQSEKLLSYISTHPATNDRINIIATKRNDLASDKILNFKNIVSDEQWQQIRNICN